MPSATRGLVAQARWCDPTRILALWRSNKRPVCSLFSPAPIASAHDLLQPRLGPCDLYISPLALQASLSPKSVAATATASTCATPICHRISSLSSLLSPGRSTSGAPAQGDALDRGVRGLVVRPRLTDQRRQESVRVPDAPGQLTFPISLRQVCACNSRMNFFCLSG
jgi:hypothetical protein